jgi:hypothetical protein
MRKTLLLITCLFAFSVCAIAQAPGPAEQKLLDSLCVELEKIDLSKITTKQEATDAFMNSFLTKADMMIEVAAEKGVEQTDQEAMHKVGLGIGVNLMKAKCAPFIKLATLMAGKQLDRSNEVQSTVGTFKRIDTKGFNYIVIAEKGSEVSFLWLKRFPDSEKFMGKTALLAGKKIVVTWKEVEAYLPLAKGYYKVKEITGIQFL